MPIYHVVRCGSCEKFQCIQQPKSGRFKCRICNTTNSVRRSYAKSNKNRDIRPICQELNLKYGKAKEVRDAYRSQVVSQQLDDEDITVNEFGNGSTFLKTPERVTNTPSAWEEFEVTKENIQFEEDDNTTLNYPDESRQSKWRKRKSSQQNNASNSPRKKRGQYAKPMNFNPQMNRNVPRKKSQYAANYEANLRENTIPTLCKDQRWTLPNMSNTWSSGNQITQPTECIMWRKKIVVPNEELERPDSLETSTSYNSGENNQHIRSSELSKYGRTYPLNKQQSMGTLKWKSKPRQFVNKWKNIPTQQSLNRSNGSSFGLKKQIQPTQQPLNRLNYNLASQHDITQPIQEEKKPLNKWKNVPTQQPLNRSNGASFGLKKQIQPTQQPLNRLNNNHLNQNKQQHIAQQVKTKVSMWDEFD